MIRRLSMTLLTLGLLIPASAQPGDPTVQISPRQDGFFYSGGRSYLGVDVRDITSDRVSALRLKEERGVEVTTVDQDAPAGKAGLKEHDVILEFNGTKVESEEQFRRMIRETPPGRTVALGISRDGTPMNINVQIGDRGKIANGWKMIIPQTPEPPDFNIPFDIQVPTYTPQLGIQVDNLGQQLAQYFGVKSGDGLLVKSVEKGSTAEKAGMKAGDVIIRANNEKISDRADLKRILRTHRNGGKLTVGIVRDKHEQNLEIELPARKSQDSSGLIIEDMDSALEEVEPEIDGVLEEVEPDVDQVIEVMPAVAGAMDEALLKVQPQVLKLQGLAQQIQPQLQKSMRKFQLQMRHLQKELEKQQKAWRIEFDDMI